MLGQLVIALLHLGPAAAGGSLVVINRNEQLAAGGHWNGGVGQRGAHVSGVVQHAPGIYDVEFSQRRDVGGIEGGAGLDCPLGVVGEIAVLEFFGAADGIGVVIE